MPPIDEQPPQIDKSNESDPLTAVWKIVATAHNMLLQIQSFHQRYDSKLLPDGDDALTVQEATLLLRQAQESFFRLPEEKQQSEDGVSLQTMIQQNIAKATELLGHPHIPRKYNL